MEEGYFRKLSPPAPFMENGMPKIDADGTLWMVVELEELGTAIRVIE